MFRLDHIAFGARDATSAREALDALGFRAVAGECRWPMPSARFAATSLSVVLPSTYLDLIAYEDPAWPERTRASSMYARGLIPSGAVLGTDDFDAAMEQLEARGFGRRPYEIRRSLSAPAAEEVRYRITPLLGAGRLPVSILQDESPLAMRTPWALRHPNAVVELARVVLRVGDPETVRLQLSRLLADVRLSRGRIVVNGLGARFELVSQPAPGLELEVSDRLPADDPVGLLMLVFLSTDLNRTRTTLVAGGVRFSDEQPDELTVAPDEGFGCGIAFVARPQ